MHKIQPASGSARVPQGQRIHSPADAGAIVARSPLCAAAEDPNPSHGSEIQKTGACPRASDACPKQNKGVHTEHEMERYPHTSREAQHRLGGSLSPGRKRSRPKAHSYVAT